jgi:3-oxoacyl-[acyl-carrier protein] reductase
VVAIVTGGSSEVGRDVARSLVDRGHAIVVVYLDDQGAAEATVEEILAAGGVAVAVRADLTDDLDVERVFTESIAAFSVVDLLVHTTTRGAPSVYDHASRHLRRGAVIVGVSSADRVAPEVAQRLRERGIAIDEVPSDAAAGDVVVVLERLDA